MNHENETPDLSSLIAGDPPETPDEARERIISEVMGRQQALAEQFSRIDHPFVTDDAKDDYELATQEFEALIKCAVHMPESVEGVRFLAKWHESRMAQVELLLKHATPGNELVFGVGTDPVAISAEFAKGMRAALSVVSSMFSKFPLELSVSDEPEDNPGE